MNLLHKSKHSAFTLIEVLLAVTIASIVMTSVMATFHTAIKAYRMGMGHSESEQRARYIMNKIASDLRNLFYLDPNSYNKYRRQIESQIESQLQTALESGMTEKEFYETQDLPELGPEVDLSFYANDSGEADTLSFIVNQHNVQTDDKMPWSLARVKYFLEDGKLKRSIGNCFAIPTDELGNEIVSENDAEADVLTENVKEFELEFGYWYDGDWMVANSWDSNLQVYRNPSTEEESDSYITDAYGNKVTEKTTAEQVLGKNSDDATSMQNLPDGVPAWIKYTLTFTDPKIPERTRKYMQIVQLYQSQETFIPEIEDTTNAAGSSIAPIGTLSSSSNSGSSSSGGNMSNRNSGRRRGSSGSNASSGGGGRRDPGGNQGNRPSGGNQGGGRGPGSGGGQPPQGRR